jgi:putative transposase
MKKDYQTRTTAAVTTVEAQLPEAVSVTLAELAGSLREGLLALAVGTGFQVMEAIIDESVTALAGPKGRHDPNRSAVRHGSESGSVTSAGAACRCVGPGCALPIGPPRWRCPPTSCSPRPTCSRR